MAHKKLYYQFNLTHKKKNKNHLEISHEFHALHDLVECLLYWAEILARKEIYGEDVDSQKVRTIDELIKRSEECDVSLIKLLGFSLRILKNPTLAGYNQLKTRYFNDFKKIDSEKSTIWNYLYNILNLIQHHNQLSELFDLIKFGVKEGFFIENNTMSPVHFRNIIEVACKSEAIDYAVDFCAKNIEYLSFDLVGRELNNG